MPGNVADLRHIRGTPLFRRFEKLLSNASRKFIGGCQLCQIRQCLYIERPGYLRSGGEDSQLRSRLPAPSATQYCPWYPSVVLAPPFQHWRIGLASPQRFAVKTLWHGHGTSGIQRGIPSAVIPPDRPCEPGAVSKRESACSAIGENFPVTAHGVQKLPVPSCRVAEVPCDSRISGFLSQEPTVPEILPTYKRDLLHVVTACPDCAPMRGSADPFSPSAKMESTFRAKCISVRYRGL